MPTDRDTHFGYRTVPLGEKQALVDEVFTSVARRYDLMNDLMSGGLHRAWKDALVTAVNPPHGKQPFAVLDVAGGTGDVAFRIAAAGGPGTHVTVCDINPDMLEVGRQRAEQRGLADAVSFVDGNAEALAFADRSFDAYTIAFGIRNVPRIEAALAQAFRVLRPGGRFLCLEFSHVDVPGLDAESYQYLAESIRRFPQPTIFADMIRSAGFRRVKFTLMTGGIVALHSGWRL